MKKLLFVVCASLVPGSLAFATVGPALLDGLSSKQARQIERLLEAKARKEIGTPMINDFKVS